MNYPNLKSTLLSRFPINTAFFNIKFWFNNFSLSSTNLLHLAYILLKLSSISFCAFLEELSSSSSPIISSFAISISFFNSALTSSDLSYDIYNY